MSRDDFEAPADRGKHEVEWIGELVEKVGARLRHDGIRFLRLARDFEAAGYRSGPSDGRPSGSVADPTANAHHDPLDLAHSEAQAALKGIHEHASTLQRLMANVLHVEKRKGRESTVEQCARCQAPILPPAKVKRMDGFPYHDISPDGELPACHSAEWRDRRKSA